MDALCGRVLRRARAGVTSLELKQKSRRSAILEMRVLLGGSANANKASPLGDTL
jgi:hypothetical protein